MNWYLEVLKKYATFAGRARRTEYWMFALINFIINTVLSIVQRSTGSTALLIIFVDLRPRGPDPRHRRHACGDSTTPAGPVAGGSSC